MNSSAAVSLAFLLSLCGAARGFGPPPPPRAFSARSSSRSTKTSTTRLDLLPLASFAESSSLLTSSSAIVDTLGSLALIGSVGFGIAVGRENKDWSYEYKVGNELSEGGTLGDGGAGKAESPTTTTTTTAEAKAAAEEEEEQEEEAVIAKVEEPKPVKPKPETPKPPKAAKEKKKEEATPAAEKAAKAAVLKAGVEETKAKMNSKVTTTTPAPAPATEVASPATETERKPGGKRRLAKGMTLILAAGAVAAARNVVKAYLGRGML